MTAGGRGDRRSATTYRRDDGVGPAVIGQLQQHGLTGVSLTVADGEPTQLLDAWAGMDLAIVVDAVLCEPSIPGRIHRTTIQAELGSLGGPAAHTVWGSRRPSGWPRCSAARPPAWWFMRSRRPTWASAWGSLRTSRARYRP